MGGAGLTGRDAGGGQVTGRIVIVEDHGLIAHTLAAALSARGLEVTLVDVMADDLVGAVAAEAPDLALLDLDLGARGSSLELIAPVAATGVPVVMLTGVSDPIRLAGCIAAGAAGVLSKDSAFDDLVGAIADATSGRPLLTAHERESHLARLRSHTAEERERSAPFDRLTRREAEVLGALMRGWSVERIADDAVVSLATVRTQVRAILTKLEVSSQLAAVTRAHDAGWRPPPPTR